MVLLTGSQDASHETRTEKEKLEKGPVEDKRNCIVNYADKLEEEGGSTFPEQVNPLQGTGDPVPQLLAVVPSLKPYINKSNNDLTLEEEYEVYDDLSDFSDTRSIASDDSFYPPELEVRDCWQNGEDIEDWDENKEFDGDSFKSWESMASPEPLSLLKACSSNNAIVLRALMRHGLSEEEVGETDKNNRTGLLVACYQGYVDIIIALSQCPYVDVNWQDNEGNTALITAAQAGHITITNYLLNYYPGLEIEKRNIHGFTALMKASIQGRTDCVRALMLAGADINAVDPNRGYSSRQWARFTGRYDTAYIMQRLMDKPSLEQFSDQFQTEWPKMKALLALAAEPKTCAQRVTQCIKSVFTFNYNEPEEDGVIDHMVKITTCIHSPFIAVSCRTICPGSPPCIGKRRYSVQEILNKQGVQVNKSDKKHTKNSERFFQNSNIIVFPEEKDRRASLQPNLSERTNGMTTRRTSLLSLNLLRRSSVRPGYVIPKVRITKAPMPTYYPENVKRRSSIHNSIYLQIPKWRYKELKEERKKAEEGALLKLEQAKIQKQKNVKTRSFT